MLWYIYIQYIRFSKLYIKIILMSIHIVLFLSNKKYSNVFASYTLSIVAENYSQWIYHLVI